MQKKYNTFEVFKRRRIIHQRQKMSVQTYTPIQNDVRYEIKLTYHKENNYVVYEMKVHDLAFGKEQLLLFRFSQIKKFNETLIKNYSAKKYMFPDFPKTNSFGLWNKTNKNPRKIQDRKRQLEFYFKKLLNDPLIRGLVQVKWLLKNVVQDRRRTRSMNFNNKVQNQKIRSTHKMKSLPKEAVYSFPHSSKEDHC